MRFALSTLAVLLLTPFAAQAVNPPGAPLDQFDPTPREVLIGVDIIGNLLPSTTPATTCTASGGIFDSFGCHTTHIANGVNAPPLLSQNTLQLILAGNLPGLWVGDASDPSAGRGTITVPGWIWQTIVNSPEWQTNAPVLVTTDPAGVPCEAFMPCPSWTDLVISFDTAAGTGSLTSTGTVVHAPAGLLPFSIDERVSGPYAGFDPAGIIPGVGHGTITGTDSNHGFCAFDAAGTTQPIFDPFAIPAGNCTIVPTHGPQIINNPNLAALLGVPVFPQLTISLAGPTRAIFFANQHATGDMAFYEATACVRGDVNADGLIDLADSVILRRLLVDLPPGIEPCVP